MITSPEANLSRRPATASVGIRFENVSYRKMSEREQREAHRKEIINNLVVRRLSCEGAHVVQRLVNGNIKPIERNGERAQRTCRCALVRKGNLLAIDKRLVRGNELTDALHAFVAMSEAILFQERLGAVSGANGTRFHTFTCLREQTPRLESNRSTRIVPLPSGAARLRTRRGMVLDSARSN